ncbi:hypothetical protein ACWDUC_39395 [Streptomyces tricolor]|uniref:hypothetical protein n=1 Tax=Streptomyces tricolor TaxID=68277 RepID=UPI003D72F1B1
MTKRCWAFMRLLEQYIVWLVKQFPVPDRLDRRPSRAVLRALCACCNSRAPHAR